MAVSFSQRAHAAMGVHPGCCRVCRCVFYGRAKSVAVFIACCGSAGVPLWCGRYQRHLSRGLLLDSMARSCVYHADDPVLRGVRRHSFRRPAAACRRVGGTQVSGPWKACPPFRRDGGGGVSRGGRSLVPEFLGGQTPSSLFGFPSDPYLERANRGMDP